jgi:hypothetical protein
VSRFVLRYRGKGEYPARTIQRIRGIGEDTGRMMLVEAPERELHEAMQLERDWLVTPETAYALPDPREAIK